MKSRIPYQISGIDKLTIVTTSPLARRRRALAVLLVICALSVFASAKPSTIITFDVPGAGTGPGQGTSPFFINPSGVIGGQYLDANNAYHGFVRSPDGAITTFDVPGAGAAAGQGTIPFSINPAGAITGVYLDNTDLAHGFLRAPDGAITTFDAPGAGRPFSCSPPLICFNGTQGAAINAAGAISGQYADATGVFHGFLRSRDGSITTFDAPDAGTSLGQGTLVTFGDGINSDGAIAGGYADANGVGHAFVRTPDGAIITFDPPGSVFTDNSGINPAGTVTSFYDDASSVLHGYVRAKDGAFTLFDVPSAGTGSGQGTEPLNINAPGDIVGAYIDASGVNHGFLRTKAGAITTFDAPGAGTGRGQGTEPVCNNPADEITGFYIDANGVNHGFLGTP